MGPMLIFLTVTIYLAIGFWAYKSEAALQEQPTDGMEAAITRMTESFDPDESEFPELKNRVTVFLLWPVCVALVGLLLTGKTKKKLLSVCLSFFLKTK